MSGIVFAGNMGDILTEKAACLTDIFKEAISLVWNIINKWLKRNDGIHS